MKKIFGVVVVIIFLMSTCAGATAIQLNDEKPKVVSNAIGKWFLVTVKSKEGNPVEDATVIFDIGGGKLYGYTDEKGQFNTKWHLRVSPNSAVKITAKIGLYTVSTTHTDEVTREVPITLQFHTKAKQKSLKAFPLLEKIGILFPAFKDILNK